MILVAATVAPYYLNICDLFEFKDSRTFIWTAPPLTGTLSVIVVWTRVGNRRQTNAIGVSPRVGGVVFAFFAVTAGTMYIGSVVAGGTSSVE